MKKKKNLKEEIILGYAETMYNAVDVIRNRKKFPFEVTEKVFDDTNRQRKI